MSNSPTKDEIIALEKDYWDAMKRKDGKRTSQLSGKLALTTKRAVSRASRKRRWAR